MSMHFDIYLRLPAIEPLADPLHFGILLTELPWFTHQIYDLMPTLWFKAVWIFAEHNSVHAEVCMHLPSSAWVMMKFFKNLVQLNLVVSCRMHLDSYSGCVHHGKVLYAKHPVN